MISIPGIIASSIQTAFARTIIEASIDYSTTSYSLCSFSAPENELPFWAFRFIDVEDLATTSYSLCSFSAPEGQLASFGLGYHFLSAEDATTNTYSICSNSIPEGELVNLNWEYYFLSAGDFITNSINLCSFNVPVSELTLVYPLSVANIDALRTSIYGVSSNAAAVFGNSRFSFTYWEVWTGGSWSIVPAYQTLNGYAYLSGGPSWYDASINALSARLIVGYQGRSYRTNPVLVKPYTSVLDIPNLQLWLDASDTNTLSANTINPRGPFIDSSSNTFTITRNGNVGQGSFSPFFPTGSTYNPATHGGSGYFSSGNVDRLTLPSTTVGSALDYGTGSFTIECWYNLIQVGPTNLGFIISQTVSGNNNLLFAINSNRAINIWLGNADLGTSANSVIPLNTWCHVALVRNGSTVNVYVNGISVFTTTNSSSLGGGMLPCINGYGHADGYGNICYISNMRIVKGTPVYTTSPFTPPTAPLASTGANTSLLLNFTNGLALDGTINNTLALYGNNTVINSGPKYGVGSFYFQGNGDYIVAPSRPNYRLGSDNFTIECWVKFNNTTTDSDGIADTGSTLGSANANQWFIYRNNNILRFGRHAVADLLTYNTSTLVPGTWYHLAVTRESGNLSMFINGTRVASANYASWVIDDSNVRIGAITTPYYMKGSIDDFRITRSVSRYGPSTALLLNGNGADNANNNIFSDSSSNFTITRNGSVTQGSFSPFPLNGATYNPSVHGGSGYFDGSSYLTIPSNNAFNFASGTFTVEAWVMFTSVASDQVVVNNYNSPTTGWTIAINLNKFYANFSGDGIDIQGTTTVVPNVWYHVAVSGSAGSYRLFVNGIQEGATYTAATSLVGGNLGIGAVGDRSGFVGSSRLNGYLSNVRIVNGTALYTSNFTPPIAPLTNIANTSLLLNFTNGGIVDSTGKSNLITVGDAKISTSVKKYGTGSMYFDGSGDYLTSALDKSDYKFLHDGATDYTVEGWFYSTLSSNRGQTIYCTGQDSFFTGLIIGINGSLSNIFCQLSRGVQGSTMSVSSPNNSWSLNSWNHFAVTFAASTKTLKLYLNGTEVSAASNPSFTFSQASPQETLNIGRSFSAARSYEYFNGYIDDLRITKGAALYTSNFTPPTQELGLTDLTTLSVAPFTPPSEHPTSSSGDSNFNNVSLLLQANEFANNITWRDKSPNANHAFQVNGTNAPIISANSIGTRSSLVFNGSTHFLNLTNPIPQSATNATSLFVYGRPTNGIFSASIGNKNSAAYNSPLLHWNNNVIYAFEGYTDAEPRTGSIVAAATKRTAVYLPEEVRCSLLTLQNSNAVDNSGTGNSMLFQTPNPTSTSVTISGVNTTAWTFNGSNSVYTSPSNNFAYGTGPFTFEAWVFPTGIHSSNFSVIYSQAWSGNNYFVIAIQTASIANHYSIGVWLGNGNIIPFTLSTAIPLSAWSHIALVREGTATDELELFINGKIVARATSAHDFSDAVTGFPTIGKYYHDSYGWVGQISNVRIVKGRAIYTQNFIPTVQLSTITTGRTMVRQQYYPTSWGVPPQNESLDGVGVYGPHRHSGPFGEFIYANCLLPTPEIELVGDSLRTKWGI